MTPTDHRHGTRAGYHAHRNAGQDPCDPCRAAYAKAVKNYRTRRYLGGDSTLVPAGPSIRRLSQLAEHSSYSQIAAALGTSHRWVGDTIAGRPQRIQPDRARAIKALLDSGWRGETPHDAVDALGTARRLQALAALGWSAARLASEIGVEAGLVKHVLAGRRTQVRRSTADQIAAWYDANSMRVPTASTDREAQVITRTKKRATQLGWVGPLCWDDIDTDEKPQGVRGAA